MVSGYSLILNFACFEPLTLVLSREVEEDQLGTQYLGVIISDDFSVYNGYPVAAQQKCQAHLRRHCQRLIKTPGINNESIGIAPD